MKEGEPTVSTSMNTVNLNMMNKPNHWIYADKIASSAAITVDQHRFQIKQADRGNSGDIVAVRVVENRQNSNPLELGNGRLATVNFGDIVIGVLGNRRALKGFVGTVPKKLAVGDHLHVLNLGGIIGQLSGSQQGLERPIQVEYLGSVVDSSGNFASIRKNAIKPESDYLSPVPLVLVSGTCMQAGKTKVAGELVKRFRHHHYKVAAAKLTGIACLRDTLLMEDYGAIKTLSFLNCGLPSTIEVNDVGQLAKGIVKELNKENPDVIIIELGDGLLGYYNVDSLFNDEQIMTATAAIPLCANDFAGVFGAIQFLKEKGVGVDVVSGPATDSPMAVDFIENQLGTPAANALNGANKLFNLVEEKVIKWQQMKC